MEKENGTSPVGAFPRKKNDIVTKAAFMEWFVDLLRFLYPNADEVFDLGRGATAMEKELLEIMPERERVGGTLVADMLMKVYLRDGTEQWLLILLEIEGQSKADFAERVWHYFIRLTDRYPVPIIPIAVFTGGPNQKRPNEYRFSMLEAEVIFRFKSFHVFDYTEEELLANPNVMSLVILACQAEALTKRSGNRDEWRLNEIKKRIVEGLLERGITDTGQIMRFIRFLNNLIYLKNKELNLNFVSTVERLTKGAITMNIMETLDAVVREEGKIEGKLEGKSEVVKNLLIDFGFSDEQAAKAAEVSVAFVRKVRSALQKKK